jgi:DNA-binding NtrC family response regulator
MMKRILLVDNDTAARRMLARVLESCAYVPLQASSEREAIASFCAARPVLVIVDLNGEQREGWKVYEEIRRLDPLVPVIGITAWSNQAAVAMRKGIDALMEKPLDLKALLAIIEQLTKDSEQDQKRSGADTNLIAPSGVQKL